MTRRLRPLALPIISLALTGCYVFGFGSVRAVPVGPGGPPNAQPTPVIPQIHLEYGGSTFVGRENYFAWSLPNGAMQGSGAVAPGFGNTLLQVPAGAAINIVIGPGAPPAVVWVAELDASGVPSRPVLLASPSTVTVFTLSTTGQYQLQVTAEWTYQNQVTYIFDVNVTR